MTTVVGADRFHTVARKLKGAADRKELVKEMRTGILKAVPALREAVKAQAADYLPDKYAAELAPSLRFRTTTKTGGSTVTVAQTVTASGRGGSARHVGDLEDGDLRHPVFYRRAWVNQRVKPRFVAEPMTEKAPAVRKEIEAAVDRVLTKLTGG